MCEFVRIVVWSNLELIVKHFSRQPSISLFQQIPPTRRMVNPTLLKLPYFIFNCVSTLEAEEGNSTQKKEEEKTAPPTSGNQHHPAFGHLVGLWRMFGFFF